MQRRHALHDFFSEGLRGGDKPRGRFGAMLGLTDKVDRDGFRIGAVVGKHQYLRRPGENVDTDFAE